jgi:AcrR family transcriptional regulator
LGKSRFFGAGKPVPRSLSPSEIEGFRNRLIAVAERLFAEQGPAAVNMRQLADALNVSVMTPYRYFEDKDEILTAVRASGFDRFADALEAAYDAAPDCAGAARAVSEAYMRFAFENPAAYKLMFDLSQPTEDDHPDLARAGARARVIMAAYIQNLLDANLLAGEPEIIAHVFWAAFHGLVVLKLADKIAPHIDFEMLWRELARSLTAGFAPVGGESETAEPNLSLFAA